MAARLSDGSGTLEAGQVRAMFDRIAGVYDLMNTAMTAGLHHRWRARAADLAGLHPGARVLDVASGTGDLALELAARVAPGGEVLGADFSEGMLDRAREKAAGRAGLAPVRFEWADAMALPYEDDSFDAATVGFGARNFADLGRGLAEMARVVRPGAGRRARDHDADAPAAVALLRPVVRSPRPGPRRGRGGRRAARRPPRRRGGARGHRRRLHLPAELGQALPGPRELAGELAAAGLEDVHYLLTAGGIVAIHAGTVPA